MSDEVSDGVSDEVPGIGEPGTAASWSLFHKPSFPGTLSRTLSALGYSEKVAVKFAVKLAVKFPVKFVVKFAAWTSASQLWPAGMPALHGAPR